MCVRENHVTVFMNVVNYHTVLARMKNINYVLTRRESKDAYFFFEWDNQILANSSTDKSKH